MKASIYLLYFLGFSFISFGQTKVIAHKSHGGTMANFATAMNNDGIDSNFGLPPTITIIDTVEYSNEHSFIVKGRNVMGLIPFEDTFSYTKQCRRPISREDIEGLKSTLGTIIYDSPFDSIVLVGYQVPEPAKGHIEKAFSTQFLDSIREAKTPPNLKEVESQKENKIFLMPSHSSPKGPDYLKWIGLFVIFMTALVIGFWRKQKYA